MDIRLTDAEKEARKQHCDQCGRAIYEAHGDTFRVFNMDDTPHVCRESLPIGEQLVGRCIVKVQLADALTLSLDGTVAFDVSGDWTFRVRVVSPTAGLVTEPEKIAEVLDQVIINRMSLRRGTLRLYFDGGAILEASGGRLSLRLMTPQGILEE